MFIKFEEIYTVEKLKGIFFYATCGYFCFPFIFIPARWINFIHLFLAYFTFLPLFPLPPFPASLSSLFPSLPFPPTVPVPFTVPVVLCVCASFSKLIHIFIHSSVSSISWSGSPWIQDLSQNHAIISFHTSFQFIRDSSRWSGPLPAPQTAALTLINARWLTVYCMATLAECRSGFRHCKSEQLALGLPPQAGLNVKQPLLRYSWAQSQDLHYSSGSFMCATCPPCSLHCPHTHHLSLTLFSWLYSTSSHLWSRATLSPVYLHYPHLKIYCSELLPVLYKWLRRCLLFGAEWSQRFLSKLIFSSMSQCC